MQWDAHWISFAYDPSQDVGVFAFRRCVTLDSVPSTLLARVSADQRYKLFVNGQLVAWGPQRGDAQHWFYETVDLAPFLVAGENWISALVWNFGWMAPMAQHSVRTAFVLEAEGLSTPTQWEVARLDNWGFAMMHDGLGEFYIDVGPGEILDFRSAPWGWRTGEDNPPAEWRPAHIVCRAEERGTLGGGTPWMLLPRSIPAMRYDVCEKPSNVRRGFAGDAGGPPEGVAQYPLQLQPGVPVVLDWRELLCAFPRLAIEGADGAELTVTYCEATWTTEGGKGNRDEVAGKSVHGYQDRFVSDGRARTIETLWWRTFRYVRLDVSEPLVLHAFDAVETGYPLATESTFDADDPCVAPIWDVSVRTAERCAGETYFDCPYYEQLQYVGDSRIQALIGYYLGRDRALQRNAVETLGWSLMSNGLTQSRYPSRQAQVIPPFSLWWVMMLYDQMLYDDPAARPDFASPQTLERVLGRFRKLQREEEQFWPFADWVPEWRWGVPPGGLNALVHQQTLDLATHAKEVLKNVWNGKPADAGGPLFWQGWPSTASRKSPHGFASSSKRTASDQPPSEHAEALHRLLLAMHGAEWPDDAWPTEALQEEGAAQCTHYFSYYKHLARRPIDYLEELKPWKEMIEDGLTTFAENPELTRSDCHAWSAHPILGFFQIVAGVQSAAPGWKAARIEPHPGSLRRFKACIAHPDGELCVALEDGQLEIDCPVPYELVWQGQREVRPAGKSVTPWR